MDASSILAASTSEHTSGDPSGAPLVASRSAIPLPRRRSERGVVTRERYTAALERVRSALAGRPGVPVVGTSFISAEAVRTLAWGAPSSDPTVTDACGRLELDFAFVESWPEGATSMCAEAVSSGTVPFWVVRGPLGSAAEARGWSETLAATVREP